MRCMCSDLEKDKVFLTNRACPLSDGVVEAFDMDCQTSILAHGLVLFIGNDSSISVPKVAEQDILLVAVR
ncbi:hypothetical protein BH24DEI2_BH24DEI2_27790 [soil metagenome]